MTLIETDAADVPWDRCPQPGCIGALAGMEACLAHLDEPGLASVLAGVRRGRVLDARGVAIDAELLSRILAACPRDDCGRPVVNRGRFDCASFPAGATFEGVVFIKGVSFDGSRFDGDASFKSTRFEGPARFAGSSFKGPASFDEASFDGQAWFGGATFSAPASFGHSEFSNLAWFGRAEFETDAAFDDATFRGTTNFDDAGFRCHVRFARTGFEGETRLDRASFNHEPRYDGAAFTGRGGAPEVAVRQLVWKGAALAPWRDRAAAGFIDLGLAVVPVVGAGLVGVVLEGPLYYSGARLLLTVLGALAGVAFSVWNLVDQGRTAQTIGKRRLGICLVRERDGLPVGVPRSIGRHALHLLDTAPAGAGWLRGFWHAKRQTFADTLLKTLVVEGRGWAPTGSSGIVNAAGPPPGGG
ncbi:MAG: pentapeptide repeat-containing protein [Acidimicrobiales bacterium]